MTLQEVIDHFRTLEQDPKCPERTDVFLDLSEVDSLPAAPQISSVVDELKRVRAKVRFDACAIVASRTALFGMIGRGFLSCDAHFPNRHRGGDLARVTAIAGRAQADGWELILDDRAGLRSVALAEGGRLHAQPGPE